MCISRFNLLYNRIGILSSMPRKTKKEDKELKELIKTYEFQFRLVALENELLAKDETERDGE